MAVLLSVVYLLVCYWLNWLSQKEFVMAAPGSLTLFSVFWIILTFLVVKGEKNAVVLNEDNWRLMLKGHWMVAFYAPWCPACRNLQSVWHDFSTYDKMLGVNIAQVDVTTSPGLSGRFMITALPTIYHVMEGEFRQYKGGRDKDSLISFIKTEKWKSVEPIPGWQSPSSFLRSVLSYFFKLSTVLRSVYNHLLEKYGLPAWGSYLILAVATIFIGTLLGLIVICIIDCIVPPKSAGKSKPLPKEEIEELDEVDDIIDDNADERDDSTDERQSDRRKSVNETEEEEEEQEEEEEEEKQEENLVETNKGVRKRKPRKAM